MRKALVVLAVLLLLAIGWGVGYPIGRVAARRGISGSELMVVAAVAASVIAVAVGGCLVAYKFAAPTRLPQSKPWFCLLPKFRASSNLSTNIAEAARREEALAERLAESGFALVRQTDRQMVFSRGWVLGEFSVKIAKVNLRFELPIQSPQPFEIEYGSFAAFDTGDLWQFTQELMTSLERNPAGSPTRRV